MKKRFKQADGTEVEVEGSPEELAEYERKIREGSDSVSVGKKSKKPVLRGAEVDGQPLTEDEEVLIRLHRLGFLTKKEKEESRPFRPWVPQFVPYRLEQLEVSNMCKFCGQFNCMQMHIWCSTDILTGTALTAGTSVAEFLPSSDIKITS